MKAYNKEKQGRKRKQEENFDYRLVTVVVFMLSLGLVMLYSASYYNVGMGYVKKQLFFSAIGFVVIYVVSKIDYHYYAPFIKLIYVASLILMALVRTSIFGREANGSQRWLKLPGLPQFQPSELAKIAVILFLAGLICTMGKEIYTKKGKAKILGGGLVAAVSVFVFTDNLSTAVIVAGITFIMFIVAHPNGKKYAAVGGIIGGILYFGMWILGHFLENTGQFRLQRIIAWVDPEKYAQSEAFQTMQGFYAIGTGGWIGKGLGKSAQKMILPEPQNDMILAIICEEFGIVGLIVILSLFGFLLYRLLYIARKAPDLFGSLIVTGIFAHIAIQVVLNVAVILNVIPTTGITLPFFSYGGTSFLFLMGEMGIALNVSRKIKIHDK